MSDAPSNGPGIPSAGKAKSNVPLIVSLCINFLLVGLIAMALVHAWMLHPPMPGPGGGMGPGREFFAPHMLMRIAPAEAEKIRRILDAHRDKIEKLRQASFEARQEAHRAFEADKFDQHAFDQSLERVRLADAALEAEALKVMSECAVTLTPEERRAVAAERPRHGQGWGHRFRHGGGGY